VKVVSYTVVELGSGGSECAVTDSWWTWDSMVDMSSCLLTICSN
jgi:hypothetical protein